MTRALLFPGQGSQIIGMGTQLAAASAVAREVYAQVDDALGQHLFRLMRDGPIETLTLTENAQPAIMAVSLAAIRVLEQDAGVRVAAVADAVAGHSLGEYSALCAAGSLDLATTAKLLKARGQAMQAAVPPGVGAMAALLGVTLAEAETIVANAAQSDICTAANDNAPGQIVISGHATAVARAIEAAKAMGKKAMNLPVSAPFHCALMRPAADIMAEKLTTTTLIAPVVPLFANVTASAVTDPATIRQLLVEQVTGRVRWRESIEALITSGCDHFIEIGTGKALTGMIKRINRDVRLANVETADDIEALLKSL